MSYMSSAFPIRDKAALYRMATEYLKRLGPSQPGAKHVPLGAILLTPSSTSMFVVRVSEREAVTRRVLNKWNGRTHFSVATHHRATSQSFRVAEIRWSDGHVTELSQHATRDEANAMLIALHGER